MTAIATAAIPRRATRISREFWIVAMRFIAAILITIVFLFPIYWLFTIALKTPEEVYASPPVWYPATPSLGIFSVLFYDGDLRPVLTSLIIAGVSTAVAMLLGTMAAYSLARFKTGGENLAMWIISQRMIPPISIVFPIFLLFAMLGWIDSYFGLILLYTAFNLPYVIWMMRGYIEDVPIELEESALVDGLNRWQAMFRIVFPMARTGFFATAVFTFIFAWNEFLFGLVLTRTEVITFPVQVNEYIGVQQMQWAKIAGMSILGTIPVFVVVAMAQRYLVRGISLGAIKG